jgi:hypothetical protein
MMKLAIVVLALSILGGAAVAAAYENSSVVGQVPDRVVLILKEGVFPHVSKAGGRVSVDIPALNSLSAQFEVRDMSRLYEGYGAPEKAGMPDLRLHWAVDFSAKYDLETVRRAFAALPEVAEAWAVDICRQQALPNDPALSNQQWYLRNTTLGQFDVRALGGWAEAVGDTNRIIAIVDSGVDWQHPDLGGTGPNYIDGNIWINWTEYNGTPGVDDDGNGKLDDIRGWDFVDVPGQGYPDEDDDTPDNDPSDYESHGTACSGIASAITNNAIGIAGAAHNCKIMAVRVGWLPNGEDIGVVRMDYASQGMLYAAAKGARIINCSWGSSSFLQTAVTQCVSVGCIIITSAGNNNDEVADYLSTNSQVLSVAATEKNDLKASFSSYGTWVELSAPGVDMYTTWYNRLDGSHTYLSTQGTSFSSPLACGCAALIWSAHPTWNRLEIMAQLMATCDDIDALNPAYAGKLGAGRINLLRALGDSFQQVPAEFPTLLDAMNEAAAGDTVAIKSSLALTGPVTMIARDLYILGGYNEDYSSRDPQGSPTVITGSVSGPALQFQSGTGSGTVMDGFRCTGGGGVIFSNLPYSARYGGGVICNQTSPTLRNFDVTGNAVGSSSQLGCGGGIYLHNSQATLESCAVHGNTGLYGAGIFIYRGSPSLTNCQIYDNTSITNNLSFTPDGGGLHVLDAEVTLTGCQVSGHELLNRGGGIYAANYGATTTLHLAGNEIYDNTAKSAGAGIYMAGTLIEMVGDWIHDNNKTVDATFMDGGGFKIDGASAMLDSLVVQNNTSHLGAGGTMTSGPSASISHSLFTGNQAMVFGSCLYLGTTPSGIIDANTFADNGDPATGSGGLYLSAANPTISNNIVAFNQGTATFGNGFHVGSGTPAFICNDVYGNDNLNYGGIPDQTGSNGNISADPEFCSRASGDYAISTDSPCAPDNSGGCGLIGAIAAKVCLTAVPGENPEVPLVFHVEQNYPNPFNPATKIVFSLPKAAFTTLVIYDLAGRRVRNLLAEPLDAARYEIAWDGRDGAGRQVAAGIYFYQVRSGGNEFTGRMALVK